MCMIIPLSVISHKGTLSYVYYVQEEDDVVHNSGIFIAIIINGLFAPGRRRGSLFYFPLQRAERDAKVSGEGERNRLR